MYFSKLLKKNKLGEKLLVSYSILTYSCTVVDRGSPSQPRRLLVPFSHLWKNYSSWCLRKDVHISRDSSHPGCSLLTLQGEETEQLHQGQIDLRSFYPRAISFKCCEKLSVSYSIFWGGGGCSTPSTYIEMDEAPVTSPLKMPYLRL